MVPSGYSEEELSLKLLEHIEDHPDATQAGMARHLGVAVGSVNWYLRRLVAKGYVKATRLQRRRLRYLLTPRGIAEKGWLAYEYLQASLHTYRNLRREARRALREVRDGGCRQIRIEGTGDWQDIVALTCLEFDLHIVNGRAPVVRLDGLSLRVDWSDHPGDSDKRSGSHGAPEPIG